MRRVLVFASLLVASAACSKGSGGRDGVPGVDGPPGNWAIAPRITSIDPGVASYDSMLIIQGSDFAVATTANEVWFGGLKADVISASTTVLTVTHVGPPLLSEEVLGDVTVVANDLVSNPVHLRVEPKGSFVSIPLRTASGVSGMIPLGDGSLALLRSGAREILDVTPDGDITLFASGLGSSASAPVSRADGIYYLTPSSVRRWFDGNDYQIFPITAPQSLAIDTTGNVYVAVDNGIDSDIVVRDYTTGAVGPFATVTGLNVRSMVAQGTKLYVWGTAVGGSPIREITTSTDVPLTAGNVDAHSMIGDGTQLYIVENGVVETVSTVDGTIATYSAKKLSTGFVDEIARNDSGEVFYRVGDRIWRVDAATFSAYVAPFSATRSIGILGDLFAGSSDTCGTGDSKGGVFYEVRLDGTLRRVVNDYCGIGTPGFFAGAFYAAEPDGSVEQVSPSGFQIPAIPTGNITSPLFVVVDGQGNLYIPNSDGGSGWRVSKYTADGNLLDANFVPSFSEQPVAGAIFGDQLALGFAASRSIRISPLVSGGALATFSSPGFQPAIAGMSSTSAGGLLVNDGSAQTLWSLASDGSATLLGPSSPDGVWYVGADGSYLSVGTDSIEMVLP